MKKVRLLNYMIAILAIMAASCDYVFMYDKSRGGGVSVFDKIKIRR